MSSPPSDPLLSVRAALVLLIAAVVGSAAGTLAFLANRDAPIALLVAAAPAVAPDPHFRPYHLAPQWPITIEIHCTDGSRAILNGTVDAVRHGAGDIARRIVIVDAVAEPLDEIDRRVGGQ
jgi:hypothetical protein